MGAPKTADFLEKTTWTLIIIIVVLSIAAVGFNVGQNDATEKSAIEVEEVAAPVEVPVEAPVEVPAETPAE
jgi:preprotein translocase subunit SecG